MSTRANIAIQNGSEQQLFYRHSDGDPGTTLKSLQGFVKGYEDGTMRRDVSQSSGWLVLHGAMEYNKGLDTSECTEDAWNPKWVEIGPKNLFTARDKQDWKCGAYEIASDISGDIEYYYIIDLANLEIRVFRPIHNKHTGEIDMIKTLSNLVTKYVFNMNVEVNGE